MTKQEQIEELRSNIYYVQSKVSGIATSDDIAEALYDVGYRKVPDDIRELIDVVAEGANKYKNLEIKYSNLCDKYRLCKDANETLKQNVINAGYQKVDRLEAENEKLREVNRQLNADYNRSLERLKSDCREIDELKAKLKERLNCDFVKAAQKQAQLEVLNRLKSSSIYDDNYLDGYVFLDDINNIIEELKK